MKIIPEEKAKTVVYLCLVVVAAGLAVYVTFFRGRAGPPVDPVVQQRNAAIQSGMPPAPAPTSELPVESRPPRGRPVK